MAKTLFNNDRVIRVEYKYHNKSWICVENYCDPEVRESIFDGKVIPPPVHLFSKFKKFPPDLPRVHVGEIVRVLSEHGLDGGLYTEIWRGEDVFIFEIVIGKPSRKHKNIVK